MTISGALHRYLCSGDFKRQLVADYRRLELLSEGGLRTAAHRLLRRKLHALGGGKEYVVTAEARLGHCIPDITIWKNGQPRFFD